MRIPPPPRVLGPLFACGFALTMLCYAALIVYVHESPLLREIVQAATSHPIVRRAVGGSMTIDWDFTLISRRRKRSAILQLMLPVTGERGRGTLLATVRRHRGQFHLVKLVFESPSSMRRAKERRKKRSRIPIRAALGTASLPGLA